MAGRRTAPYVAVAVLATAIGMLPGQPAAAKSCWAADTVPATAGSAGYLYGVSVLSECNAWAVGFYRPPSAPSSAQPLVEHWNGSQWSVEANLPLPNADQYTALNAVAAASAANVWAVGRFWDGSAWKAFTEHYDGAQWSLVTSRNPSATYNNLAAVTVLPDGKAWGVGSYVGTSLALPFVEHWNGTKWVRDSVPNPANPAYGIELGAVKATSDANVWAVGGWNQHPVIEHWNGSRWRLQKTPTPANTAGFHLASIDATSAKSAFVAGDLINNSQQRRPFILHWDGSSWKRQSAVVADPAADNVMNGVVEISPSNVWAVGSIVGDHWRTLIEHWNGSTWSRVSSPNPGASPPSDLLWAVAASSGSDVWAVGQYFDGSASEPMALHLG